MPPASRNGRNLRVRWASVSFNSHTSHSLDALDRCLTIFHANKDVFIELGVREHFYKIPKLHSMKHYVQAIRYLGSLDGYNTESPERLHIDYAKRGYRASNKRDYTEQMTFWLQRQEAVARRQAYFDWMDGELEKLLAEIEVLAVEDADSPEEEEEEEEGESTATPDNMYAVAKRSPFPNMLISDIELKFEASQFKTALTAFLKQTFRNPILPGPYDRFDLFKQITIRLPPNRYLSLQERKDRIRATPFIPQRGRKPPSPAHFDNALVIEHPEDGDNICRFHDCLNVSLGLRAARVRAIFLLPRQFGEVSHPLAYIEWYTPFREPEKVTGLYNIQRSTRNSTPNAVIVSIDRLARACHLMARCGRKIDHRWTSENVLDLAPSFYLNTYIHLDTFSVLRTEYT
ncbi:hypothetical protein C8J56DRAFT_864056 [Mycena floridula]|nr:hypothetical protein C8J56DRAFT_864056 [Mycena floridula]